MIESTTLGALEEGGVNMKSIDLNELVSQSSQTVQAQTMEGID